MTTYHNKHTWTCSGIDVALSARGPRFKSGVDFFFFFSHYHLVLLCDNNVFNIFFLLFEKKKIPHPPLPSEPRLERW